MVENRADVVGRLQDKKQLEVALPAVFEEDKTVFNAKCFLKGFLIGWFSLSPNVRDVFA